MQPAPERSLPGMFPSLVGFVSPSSAHCDKRRDSRPTPDCDEPSGPDPVGVVSPQEYVRVLKKWKREGKVKQVEVNTYAVAKGICFAFELLAPGNTPWTAKVLELLDYPVEGQACMVIRESGKSLVNPTEEMNRLALGGSEKLLSPANYKRDVGMMDAFPFHRHNDYIIPAWIWRDPEWARLWQEWVEEVVARMKAEKKAHFPNEPATDLPLASMGMFSQKCCRRDDTYTKRNGGLRGLLLRWIACHPVVMMPCGGVSLPRDPDPEMVALRCHTDDWTLSEMGQFITGVPIYYCFYMTWKLKRRRGDGHLDEGSYELWLRCCIKGGLWSPYADMGTPGLTL
ncbi:hypothetical protein B484DRAFT_468961, partial [Ochromonadaceae sp. CCMP2298]